MLSISALRASSRAVRLRAVSSWGDTILGVTELPVGRSLRFETGELAFPRPAGAMGPAAPLEAQSWGWWVQVEGATGGRLWIDGAAEGAPLCSGARLERPGDRGLLCYGDLELHFEVLRPTPRPPVTLPEPLLPLAVLFALVALGGWLALAATVTDRAPTPPSALLDPRQLARTYRLTEVPAPSLLPPPGSHAPSNSPSYDQGSAASTALPHDPEGAVARALARDLGHPLPPPPREVIAVLLAQQAEVERCYRADPIVVAGARGRFLLRWVVGPAGAAERVISLGSDPAASSSAARCLVRHVASLRFPARAVATEVAFTFQAVLR